MTRVPRHPDLALWSRLIERLGWAGLILDADLRLEWVSPEVERFLGSPPEDEIGYGLHATEALARDVWRRVATSGTRDRLLQDLAPFARRHRAPGAESSSLHDQDAGVRRDADDGSVPPAIATWFEYVEPDGDLPTHRVDVLAMGIPGSSGENAGVLLLGYMSVRPGLVSLLARGDQDMYERMAKLVEPASREAAVLFCDLEASTELSRTLPSAEYFQLIRNLWTQIDRVVAENSGIIGKHAGDGASAFFLVEDLGSASGAARAAVRTARLIHERSEQVFGEVLDSPCLMRVGIHWGNALYIGQLVPGGRLDVTALGDPVNECARIQECAERHQTLASKSLVERLDADHAAAVGIDPDKVRYRLVRDLSQGPEKAVTTVGAIPVTAV